MMVSEQELRKLGETVKTHEELELIAEAGDVADVKELAQHLIKNNNKELAIALYRAIRGSNLDRDAVRRLAVAEYRRYAQLAAWGHAVAADQRLVDFALGHPGSHEDLPYVLQRLGAPRI